MLKRFSSASIYLLFTLFVLSCGPTSYEEYYEFRELAEITAFSVPDSVSAVSIPVSISAILGRTTASSLDGIAWNRTDSLFQFIVFAKRIDRYGEQYETKDITLDTTLILTTDPPRTGLHYFEITSLSGAVLVDSARLY